MILAELYRHYERLSAAGELPSYGFSREKVTGCVVLRADGSVFAVEDRREDAPRGRATVKVPRLLRVPQPPAGRTSAVKPAFLYDNAQYLFGWTQDAARRDRAAQCFAAEAALHAAVLAGIDHPAARAVLAFFRTWTPGTVPRGADPEVLGGFLAFNLIDDDTYPYIQDVPEIMRAWETHLSAETEGATIGQCLVTGMADQPIARIHPMVKGVPGAQTSGAALVSFNADAYTSYGRGTDNLNAPVSIRAAHGYTAALNSLLSMRDSRHVVIGQTSVVFWAERGARQFEENLSALVAPRGQAVNNAAQDRLGAAMRNLRMGRLAVPPDEERYRFFILGLSPNAARLAVRFWSADRLGDVADRVAQHVKDLELARGEDWRGDVPSLPYLALVTKLMFRREGEPAKPSPNDQGLAKVQADLTKAALMGEAYPTSVAVLLLDRFRADHEINHARVALLKAWLVRRRRFAGHPDDREGMLVSLEENRTDQGYLLGRLFAVLEDIQEAALGRDINAGIKDRFIGAASGTPGAVFPRLLTMAQHHLRKARREKPGWAYRLEQRLGALTRALGRHPAPFPATLDLEGRGLFFIGYYHEQPLKKAKGNDDSAGSGEAPSTTVDTTDDTTATTGE